MRNKNEKCLCLANGYDFGDYRRIGLTPLNQLERTILSTVRLYNVIIKLQHSKTSDDGRQAIKGHCVAFTHDAPLKAGNIFRSGINFGDEKTIEELLKTIKLCFIAENGKIDRLISTCMQLPDGVLCARGWVILQWLTVLKHVNHKFYDDVVVPTQAEINLFLSKLKKALKGDAIIISDEDALQYEKALGDDVAKVRTNNETITTSQLDSANDTEGLQQRGKSCKIYVPMLHKSIIMLQQINIMCIINSVYNYMSMCVSGKYCCF